MPSSRFSRASLIALATLCSCALVPGSAWGQESVQDWGWSTVFDRSGIQGNVQNIAEASGSLYIAGSNLTHPELEGAHRLLRWDGSVWSAPAAQENFEIRWVDAMVEFEGELFVAGRFRRLRGVHQDAYDIARWDGDRWGPIDTKVNGAVFALVARDDGLYLGGSFVSAGHADSTHGIARWDGSYFHSVGGGIVEQLAVDSRVNGIAFVGDDLYIGGRFDGEYAAPAGTNIARIARWDGSQWHSLAGETAIADREVHTLAAMGADLYVVGTFSSANGVPASDKLARWDGSQWHAVGGGGLKTMPNIAVHEGELYAAAQFHDFHGVPDAYGLGRWDGSQWHPVGNTFSGYSLAALFSSSALGGLYVGGAFDVAGTSPKSSRIARLVSGEWHSVGFEPGGAQGLNLQVTAIATDGSAVYAGGAFGDAGWNTRADRIARWDGTQWHNLGSSPFDAVSSIAVHEGEVYAASYRSYLENFAVGRFDGTKWHRITGTYRGEDLALPGSIYVIEFSDDQLYVGGQFSQDGINNIAMWNGASWDNLGGGLPGRVQSILATDSVVYVGGRFVPPNGSDQDYGVAVWDGTEWGPLGAPLGESGVRTMVATNDAVYFGGIRESTGFIKRYDGITMTDITPAFTRLAAGSVAYVNTLQVLGDDLYVGGAFASVDGIPGTSGFARYDGERWHSYAGGVNGSVFALATTEEGLYVGGSFESVGTDSIASHHIAFYPDTSFASLESDLPSDDAPSLDGTLELSSPYPNPTQSVVRATFGQAEAQPVRITLHDALGREISVVHEGLLEGGRTHDLTMDAQALASGVYYLRASNETATVTRLFVVAQ